MRTALTLLAALIFQAAFGQIKYGTYKITGGTKDFGAVTLFSELIIKKNNIFTYKYLTSLSCFFWHDSYGKWTISRDTLVLTDTVISHHPVVNFTKHKETMTKIAVSVKTKQGKSIKGIRLYIFSGNPGTAHPHLPTPKACIIDTKNRSAIKKEGKYKNVDEVEIRIVYFNKTRAYYKYF